jgi:hypothetical protein
MATQDRCTQRVVLNDLGDTLQQVKAMVGVLAVALSSEHMTIPADEMVDYVALLWAQSQVALTTLEDAQGCQP